MRRTTSVAVAKLIEVDSTIDLDPFIETANSIVTGVCVGSTLGYGATTLELIERWLSAHFYAIRDMRVASEGAGTVQRSFQYKLGLNLASTMYGQQAMLVDYKGALAALNKSTELGRRRVGISWLGEQPENFDIDDDESIDTN